MSCGYRPCCRYGLLALRLLSVHRGRLPGTYARPLPAAFGIAEIAFREVIKGQAGRREQAAGPRIGKSRTARPEALVSFNDSGRVS